MPVSITDVLAEYARLRDEEGWTQERIAKVKGVSRPVAAKRQKFHTMSERIKESVRRGSLSEGHLDEIAGVFVVEHFSPWLATAQAWEELAAKSEKKRRGIAGFGLAM